MRKKKKHKKLLKGEIYGVYVVEIDNDPKQVYVGCTSKLFEERLKIHMNGKKDRGQVFKDGGKGVLRPDLYDKFPIFIEDEDGAKEKECETAKLLDSQGYTVYGHSKQCCGIKNKYKKNL